MALFSSGGSSIKSHDVRQLKAILQNLDLNSQNMTLFS